MKRLISYNFTSSTDLCQFVNSNNIQIVAITEDPNGIVTLYYYQL